jgi:hypothetical protein
MIGVEPSRPPPAPTDKRQPLRAIPRGIWGLGFVSMLMDISSEMIHAHLAYWWLALIASLFTLARFGEAFLLLRATGVGLPVAYVPLVMVAMNVVYSLSAYPAGVLSDLISAGAWSGSGSPFLRYRTPYLRSRRAFLACSPELLSGA